MVFELKNSEFACAAHISDFQYFDQFMSGSIKTTYFNKNATKVSKNTPKIDLN